MKKILSLFMSLIMAVSVFTVANVNAYASQSVNVKFCQSEARTVLSKVNAFRTGSDAWYWNDDNTTKTYVTDAKPLAYDYTLEKIAMQRACELYFNYSHDRPDGSSVFTAYTQYNYSSQGKGENIAYGYATPTEKQLDADAVHNAWREDKENYNGQGHRRAMLDSRFTAIGVAHITYYDSEKDVNVHFWAEEFGTTVSDTIVTPANDSTVTVTINDNKQVTVSGLAPTVTTTATTTVPTTSTTVVTSVSTTSPTATTSLALASKPNQTSIKSLKKGKKSITVTWKKANGVKGYQLQLSTDKKFKKNKKSVTIKKQKTTKTTVKKLSAKKKYYVRIRTYKVVNGNKVYSSWSKAKSVKTK